MTGCQHHMNHHCVHSHTCRDREHQKILEELRRKQFRKGESGKKYKPCMSECKFRHSLSLKKQQLGCESCVKMEEEMAKVKIMKGKLQAVCRSKDEENRHLVAQLDYYRNQLQKLSANTTVDINQQVKRHLKEISELSLKIKQLLSQNYNLAKEVDELTQAAKKFKGTVLRKEKGGQDFEQKYRDLYNKYHKVCKDKEAERAELTKLQKEKQASEARHNMVREQDIREYEQLKEEVKSLTMRNQNERRKHKEVLLSKTREIELLQLDLASKIANEKVLEEQIVHKRSGEEETSAEVRQLRRKCDQLTEDLGHANKIIDRLSSQLDLEKLRQTSKEFIGHYSKKKDQQDSQKFPRQEAHQSFSWTGQHFPLHETNRPLPKISLQHENTNLRETITHLQLQIRQYQTLCSSSNTEAYRKLLEEKNTVIKQLMRDKADIYRKVCRCAND